MYYYNNGPQSVSFIEIEDTYNWVPYSRWLSMKGNLRESKQTCESQHIV